MSGIVHQTLPGKMLAFAAALVIFPLVIVSCGESAVSTESDDDLTDAAEASLVVWSLSRRVIARDVSSRVLSSANNSATVLIEADLRWPGEDTWQPIAVVTPVQRTDGRWRVSPVAAVDPVVQAALRAETVANFDTTPSPISTLAPVRPVESTPSPTATLGVLPTPPPPPEGTLIYQSDWTGSLDGWIGTPDWHVQDGRLVSDGTRAERDPWLEAPPTVEPWQSMIVEFQAEVPTSDYGSFGLIARGSGAGWYEIGLRWEDFARGSGSPVVTLGASMRNESRRVREEFLAVRKPLTAGAHLYRIEFMDGTVRVLIDGDEVAVIADGQFYAGEFLGLWSDRTPVTIYFFRVTLV